jgi:hypothetical protein
LATSRGQSHSSEWEKFDVCGAKLGMPIKDLPQFKTCTNSRATQVENRLARLR